MTAAVQESSASAVGSKKLHLEEVDMTAQSGRVPSLDGLRAVSVMIVLCSHFISSKIFPGSLGVYIFFVISGFLITRLLLAEDKKEGRISLLRFYGRRALRLYPVVIFYTVAVVGVYMAMDMKVNWREPISVLFYFANYYYAPMPRQGAQDTMPFEPLWSLSVEEHFYFLLPAAMLFLRRHPRELLITMVAICVLCLAYRLVMAAMNPSLLDTRFFYFRTEARLDSLAYGVALAAMCEMPKWRERLMKFASPVTLVIAGAVILGTLVWRDPFFRETVRYSVQGCAITAAIVAILFRSGWLQYLLNTRPVVFVGYISYSLYVWSICTREIVRYVTGLEGVVALPVLFLTAFGLACASYFLLEKPLQEFRRRMGSVAWGRQRTG